MSLARKILDIFCNSGTSDIGIFGSKYNGSSDVSTDPDDIQRGQGGNNTNWAEGWARAIVTNQAPCLEDMNGVMYVLSYMTKYLYQNGLAEWDASEGYGLYAMTQYGGSLYMSIQTDPLQANLNLNHNPSSSPTWWKEMTFTQPWVAGRSYSVNDIVNYNGRTYKCMTSHTASSLFVSDFYTRKWDDGNTAGTIIHSTPWNQGDIPYGYFDVTGNDAGREISQSTFSSLYQVIGNSYNQAYSYYNNASYPAVASGNFRLPDFRNTFFKNAGSNTRGAGHNAYHTHNHNRGGNINLNHDHFFPEGRWVPASFQNTNTWIAVTPAGNTGYSCWAVTSSDKKITSKTATAVLPGIPALSISYEGSLSYPEPNYYGIKILLKY